MCKQASLGERSKALQFGIAHGQFEPRIVVRWAPFLVEQGFLRDDWQSRIEVRVAARKFNIHVKGHR